MKTNQKEPTLVIIADLVIKNYGLNIRDRGRGSEVCKARWIYFKLARDHTSFSAALIGSEIGRDHSTVLHYYKNIQNPYVFTGDLEHLFEEYSSELKTLLPDLKRSSAIKTTKNVLQEYRKNKNSQEKKIAKLKDKLAKEIYNVETLTKELSLEKTTTAELKVKLVRALLK